MGYNNGHSSSSYQPRPPRGAAPSRGRPRPPTQQYNPPPTPHFNPSHMQQQLYPQQMPYQQPQMTIPYNTSGGYMPQMWSYPYGVPNQPTFARNLFQQPMATPDGYSYSQAYIQQNYQPIQAPPPPMKKQRVDTFGGSPGGGKGAWRNCSQPGCKFVGSGEAVEIHEGDRHLIFPNGNKVERSEEEELYAQHKGPPPPIQGTGITLHTEEDIAKWVAERRLRWPSAKRAAAKEAERKAARTRGEYTCRGRGRGRGRGGDHFRRDDPASRAEDWGRSLAPGTAHEELHDRGRGGDRGRGNDRGRERGRERGGQRGDGRPGWNGDSNDTLRMTTTTPMIISNTVIASKVPPSGVVDYASGPSSSETESSSSSESDDDSSVITPQFQARIATVATQSNAATAGESTPGRGLSTKLPCQLMISDGKCNLGDRCTFSHVITEEKPVPTKEVAKPRRVAGPQIRKKQYNAFARPSMLGSLLATPVQNTLSQLSQTIRFLVANNMLENVEFQPGQAEEEERKRKRIVVLDDKATPADM